MFLSRDTLLSETSWLSATKSWLQDVLDAKPAHFNEMVMVGKPLKSFPTTTISCRFIGILSALESRAQSAKRGGSYHSKRSCPLTSLEELLLICVYVAVHHFVTQRDVPFVEDVTRV